jgi:DNA-directed RNA polymerase specialized sigma24 family protein
MVIRVKGGQRPEQEQHDSLLEALDQLTPEERCVCEWRRLGFTSPEIARNQRTSVRAVDELYRQALAKIRGLLP